MESLLRWGIANSSRDENGQNVPPAPRQDLDPGIIDAILGKSDSELMKEALAIAVDEKRGDDERVQALDDFEMLVEQIDNANNLEKLKMWEPLQELLTSPLTSDGIKMQTLWVIGTAVQNNPSAQNAYLSKSPMPVLIDSLAPSVKSSQMRSKAVYALSGLMKHSAAAVKAFDASGGWKVLKAALEDSDISVRRKTVFLLSTLLTPTTPTESSQSQSDSQRTYPTPTEALSTNTSMTLHPTASSNADSGQLSSAPVHPNSHAEMVADPMSFSTSPITVKALEEHRIIDSLVSSLLSPVPFGPYGDREHDVDLEEKVIYLLWTYVVRCKGQLSLEQKKELHKFLQDLVANAGSEEQLVDGWPLTVDQLREFTHALE